jgi:hypothetical protein
MNTGNTNTSLEPLAENQENTNNQENKKNINKILGIAMNHIEEIDEGLELLKDPGTIEEKKKKQKIQRKMYSEFESSIEGLLDKKNLTENDKQQIINSYKQFKEKHKQNSDEFPKNVKHALTLLYQELLEKNIKIEEEETNTGESHTAPSPLTHIEESYLLGTKKENHVQNTLNPKRANTARNVQWKATTKNYSQLTPEEKANVVKRRRNSIAEQKKKEEKRKQELEEQKKLQQSSKTAQPKSTEQAQKVRNERRQSRKNKGVRPPPIPTPLTQLPRPSGRVPLSQSVAPPTPPSKTRKTRKLRR